MKFILLIIYLAGVVFIMARLGRMLDSDEFERMRREEDPLDLLDRWPAMFSMVIAMSVAFWPISILLVMATAILGRMGRDGGGS